MADSQVESQQQQQQPSEEQSSGLFSKIGVTMPSFSVPWGNKTDEAAPAPAAAPAAADGAAPAEGDASAEGGFLSGVSGGFSKLTGGLPSVSVPSFGLPSMPWAKKEGEQPADAATTELPAQTEAQPQANGEKSDFLSGVSGGFSKLTGGLPSVTLPSMPWSKKDGEADAQPAAEQPRPDAAAEEKQQEGVTDKFSSAVTSIFGVFKSNDQEASANDKASEDTTPK